MWTGKEIIKEIVMKYKLIDKNDNCVLVQNTETQVYKVIDIENDVISMTKEYDHALNAFNSYDIEKVRKAKRKALEDWLKINTGFKA